MNNFTHNYSVNDLLKIGKRINNNRRSYILINPLQAKHIPVKPKHALKMMQTLGELIASKYQEIGLVIGFAETATAIGAVVANSLPSNPFYITTTRETYACGQWLEFREEHSHAVEQKIYAENLETLIDKSKTILIVDDEISTGNTVKNFINILKDNYPSLKTKEIVIASIINRLDDQKINELLSDNIKFEFVLSLKTIDSLANLNDINISQPSVFQDHGSCTYTYIKSSTQLPNIRFGQEIKHYFSCIDKISDDILPQISAAYAKTILVLGTEECMLPALIFAKHLSEMYNKAAIYSHSTTRSPIGISNQRQYPLHSGYILPSLYCPDRTTYVYNLKHYDLVLIVTDAHDIVHDSVKHLAQILHHHNSHMIFVVQV